MTTEYSAREILLRTGIGEFNATMLIPYMFLAPASTDPKSPPIILLVGELQRMLQEQGYPVVQTGYLNLDTAHVLQEVVGERWETLSWFDVVNGVIRAERAGPANPQPQPLQVTMAPKQAVGMFDFLPDVPGGVFTYGIAAYFLYKHMTKNKKRA